MGPEPGMCIIDGRVSGAMACVKVEPALLAVALCWIMYLKWCNFSRPISKHSIFLGREKEVYMSPVELLPG